MSYLCGLFTGFLSNHKRAVTDHVFVTFIIFVVIKYFLVINTSCCKLYTSCLMCQFVFKSIRIVVLLVFRVLTEVDHTGVVGRIVLVEEKT